MFFPFFLLLPDAPSVFAEEWCRRGLLSCTPLYAPSSSYKLSRIFAFIMLIVSPSELKLHPK